MDELEEFTNERIFADELSEDQRDGFKMDHQLQGAEAVVEGEGEGLELHQLSLVSQLFTYLIICKE
ncbi:hypothetical protein HanOQP8_Chr16g0606841 [Helianthus annuus]|nr:hypothetical protein HanLR1_Chr16g0610591 [Helianthus annuus]KAJ0643988.1 hypothetical protein HanOQP8_Chr16g0606841 [Helianthus annuus]